MQRAREKAASIELPAARIQDTLREVRDCADDRAAVIMLFALIEDLLTELMKGNMDAKLKGGLSRLFDHQGVLGTASARITLAAALQWVTPGIHAELDLLRKMRNEFAHKVRVRHLTDDPVAGWLTSMHPGERDFQAGLDEALRLKPVLQMRPMNEYTPRQRLVARGASLVGALCWQIPSMPLAREHGIHPREVFGSYDDMPVSAREVQRALVEAVFPILVLNPEADNASAEDNRTVPSSEP